MAGRFTLITADIFSFKLNRTQILALAQTWHARISYESQALALYQSSLMSLLCRARAGRYTQIIIFYFLIQKICARGASACAAR